MSEELKPCPFCGSEAEWHSESVSLTGWHRVRCSVCYASAGLGDKDEIKERLNRRAGKAEIFRAVLDAMEFENLDEIESIEHARRIGQGAAYLIKAAADVINGMASDDPPAKNAAENPENLDRK